MAEPKFVRVTEEVSLTLPDGIPWNVHRGDTFPASDERVRALDARVRRAFFEPLEKVER